MALGFTACSQIRITAHPAALNCTSVSWSRARVRAILARHQALLWVGHVQCAGHPCQKHPSTKTAIFSLRRTMSAVRRRAGRGRASVVNRTPALRSMD